MARARLTRLLDYVPSDTRLIDVGTDHAYLPCLWLKAHPHACAVAIDNKMAPLENARATRRRFGLDHRLTLICQDGLGALPLTDRDTVVMSGLGGCEMAAVIEPRADAPVTWVLSPQTRAMHLRSALCRLGLTIVDEDVVLDRGRAYEVIVARHGSVRSLTPVELWLGPVLWRRLTHQTTPEIALLALAGRVMRHAAEAAAHDHEARFVLAAMTAALTPMSVESDRALTGRSCASPRAQASERKESQSDCVSSSNACDGR